MLKYHFEDTVNTEEGEEVYESMTKTSRDIMMKYSGCSEDIKESMLGIDPECAEDLCKINVNFFIDFIITTMIIAKLVVKLLLMTTVLFLSDEVMNAVDENPEEAMLRKFFQGFQHLNNFQRHDIKSKHFIFIYNIV